MSADEKKPLLPLVLPPRYEWIRHFARHHPGWAVLALLVVTLPATATGVTFALYMAHKLWP